MGSVLVVGGSRGLGAALSKELSDVSCKNWVLSRSSPDFLSENRYKHIKWIEADLTCPQEAAEKVSRELGDVPLEVLIYNAGIWEKSSLCEVDFDLIESIINVNLVSALTIIKKVIPNLRLGSNSNIILVGSTCGLENEGAQVAGYVSTKFALRGLAYALRETLRKDWIKVCCISPGSMATDVDLELGAQAALDKYNKRRMPVGDIVSIVKCITTLSSATCVKEIIVPATVDTDV